MARWRLMLKAAAMAALVIVAPGLAQACVISILGDSLTAGFGVAMEDALPRRLEAALRDNGRDCRVVDAGVSGDTAAGGAARLDWVLAERPTHLLVELGGNDALRALPVEQLRASLDDIVTRAEAAGVEVMLAGMLAPPNLGSEYGSTFADAYRSTAQAHGVPLYPFFLDGVVLEPTLMQDDGIHPNAAGVAEIVRRLLPMLTAWLDGGPS